MYCHTCKYSHRGGSEDPCIDCVGNEVNHIIPEIDAFSLDCLWEPKGEADNEEDES